MGKSVQQERAKRPFGVITLACLIGLLILGTIGTLERMLVVSRLPYPTILAAGEMEHAGLNDVLELRRTACTAHPIEVLPRPDGSGVLRCGIWWYQPSTHTYVVRHLSID